METKQKGRGGFVVTIVLLSLLVLGLAGFICYDKFLKDNISSNPSGNVNKEEETINDDQKGDFTNNESNTENIANNVFLKDILNRLLNRDLSRILYRYKDTGIKLENLTNNEKAQLAGMEEYVYHFASLGVKSGQVIVSLSTLKDNLNEIYGSDYNIQGKDFDYSWIVDKKNIINYNNTNGCFEFKLDIDDFSTAFLYGESSDSWIDFYKISSVVKKDNYYVVNMNGIYEYSDVGPASYWNDSGFKFNNEEFLSIDEIYQKYSDKFMDFELTFKETAGRLVLDSFKKA